MADDDDDEGFGDFTFAPANQTVGTSTSIINGSDFVGAAANDDDEWGDFVNYGGLSHTLSLRNLRPSDPFRVSADRKLNSNDWDPTQPGSAPGRVNSGSIGWEKPEGALPLSLFGEMEEEEQMVGSCGGDPSSGNGGANLLSSVKNVGSVKKESSANVSDLIANLYNQRQSENGSTPGVNGSNSDPHGPGPNWSWASQQSSVVRNEPESNSGESHSDWQTVKSNGNESTLNGNSSNLVIKDGNLGANGVNLSLINSNEKSNDGDAADDDNDYDDGWEFMAAEAKAAGPDGISQIKIEKGHMHSVSAYNSTLDAMSIDSSEWKSNSNGLDSTTALLNVGMPDFKNQSGDESSKDGQMKIENAVNTAINVSNLHWDVLRSYSNGLSVHLSGSNLDGKQNSNMVEETNDFGDAYGWGFQGAESESHTKNSDQSYFVKSIQTGQIKTENGPTIDNSFNSNQEMLSLDEGWMNSHTKEMEEKLQEENDDYGSDDGWEFRTAESESMAKDKNAMADRKRYDSEVDINVFESGNGGHGHGDSFGAVPTNNGEWDFGVEFKQNSLIQVGMVSTVDLQSKHNDAENRLHLAAPNGNINSDDYSWGFKDAFSETGLKEEPKVADVSPHTGAFSFNSEIQGGKLKFDNHSGALPLSIFGDEEKEVDDPMKYQDNSTQMPNPNSRFGSTSTPKVSINDLLLSLYSQAEQNTSVHHALYPSESGPDSSKAQAESSLAEDDDNDFDDDSWDFKDASSGTQGINQTSTLRLGESVGESSPELNDYVDFFSILKEKLHIIVQSHLENLKKAQTTASLTSGDDRVQVVDEEIQEVYEELFEEVYNELRQLGPISNEVDSQESLSKDLCLDDFIGALQDPKFQLLESVYQLSDKLLSVENDLESAVELLKHVMVALKILTLVSLEEQASYVSAWYNMLSACFRELKRGVLIWRQSFEKNVQHQILSEPRGKMYILALAEIYRVVEVLGSSLRLFKPWILASSTDPMGMLTLLNECYTLWSTSGLEQALKSIGEPADFDYEGSPTTLVESIKYIHDVDAVTLCNQIFSTQDPICGLSLLTEGAVPGLRTVAWNEGFYFLPLANLWANLISYDPLNLPSIQIIR